MPKFSSSLFAAIACLIVIIASCCSNNENIPSALYQAEAIMLDKPDSALNILQTIDTESLRSEESRALHALLLSQAYHKNYIDITNDSLIMVAVNYYADSDDHFHRMLAHYYHACIQQNAGKYAQSATSCLIAEELALESNDHFYLGLIYRTLSDLHFDSYNFENAVNYATKSYIHFSKTNAIPHTAQSQLAIAVALQNHKQFEKSDSVFHELINNPIIATDTTLYAEVLNFYAHLLWVLNKEEESSKILLFINHSLKSPLHSISLSHLAQMYLTQGKIDSTEIYISRARDKAKTIKELASIDFVSYKKELKQGNIANAMKYLTSVSNLQDSATRIIWKQSIQNRTQDYLNSKNLIAKKDAQIHKTIALAISILLLLIVTFVIYYIRKIVLRSRSKIAQIRHIKRIQELRRNAKLSEFEKQIEILSARLTAEETQIKIHQEEINIQREEIKSYTELSQYNQLYRQLAETATKNSSIISAIKYKSQTYDTIITQSEWEQLDSFVNTHFPKFRYTLEKLTKLSDFEYQVCLLLKCGFIPSEISNLTHRSKSAISNVRTRLFNKAFKNNTDFKSWDDFIRAI